MRGAVVGLFEENLPVEAKPFSVLLASLTSSTQSTTRLTSTYIFLSSRFLVIVWTKIKITDWKVRIMTYNKKVRFISYERSTDGFQGCEIISDNLLRKWLIRPWNKRKNWCQKPFPVRSVKRWWGYWTDTSNSRQRIWIQPSPSSPTIDVHVLKPFKNGKRWYIKFYFIEPDAMFISVHESGV